MEFKENYTQQLQRLNEYQKAAVFDESNTTIIRYLIADNRAFGSIHDKPDIGFDTTDFDVCLISSKYIASFVIVVVYERFYADRGGFAIVGNLLV